LCHKKERNLYCIVLGMYCEIQSTIYALNLDAQKNGYVYGFEVMKHGCMFISMSISGEHLAYVKYTTHQPWPVPWGLAQFPRFLNLD
jgi:hypothetical protein